MSPSPESLGHDGWTGWSDPMSRAVFVDLTVKDWHVKQAHSRALQSWAADPRRAAIVPTSGFSVSYNWELDALDSSEVVARVWVHLSPYMLHPDWDVPAHPPTWLVELVDGPLAGGMHTIPWNEEKLPPSKINMPTPADGTVTYYYLRDVDPINGVARYTATCFDEWTHNARHVVEQARIHEVTVLPDADPTNGVERYNQRRGAAGPGGDAL